MAQNPTHLAEILSVPPDPAYRVTLIAQNGTVSKQVPISVRDDDHGRERARAMVNGHATELWDGMRFIEYYPSHH